MMRAVRFAVVLTLAARVLCADAALPVTAIPARVSAEKQNPFWAGKDFWNRRHAAKLAEIAAGPKCYDCVFVGDSITHNWEGWSEPIDVEKVTKAYETGELKFPNGPGRRVWEELKRRYTLLNLGIGGDSTQHVLWRLENGEMDGYTTRLVMLMIGANNYERPVEDVAMGIRACVEKIREKQPQATILLSPIFPSNEKADAPRRLDEDRINAIARGFADGRKVIWLDFNAKFLTADGTLTKEMMPDSLHPLEPGYRIWRAAIEPYLADSVPSAGANWIAGRRQTPPESDYKAFFADSPAPVLTRTFEADKVAKAVWRIAAPGLCDAFVNGQRVTATTLMPWTDFNYRVLERAFDVTPFVREGTNELRLELGNGWWNPLPMLMWGSENLRLDMAHGDPCVKATLELTAADGMIRSVPTDANWSAADGRVLFNNLYLGERVDARRAVGSAEPVRVVTGPLGKVLPADIPETVVYKRCSARRIYSPRRGMWVVDFGENLAGNVRMTFRGLKRGTQVTATYGECLNPDLTVNVMTSVAGQMKDPKVDPPGIACQRDVYWASGEPVETYEPRFTFHAFRYLELTGLPAEPSAADFTALAYSADVRETGSFVCSDERVNRLWEVCRRTFRANLRSVQSDCPGRERFCYGGDISASGESFILNYDMSRIYRKILRDRIDAAERCGGFIPYLSPILNLECSKTYRDMGFTIDLPVFTDFLIRYYGETDVLDEVYPTLVRFLDLCECEFTPETIPSDPFGDHEALEKTDTRVSALCHYHLFLKLTAKFARRLGKTEDAARFERTAASTEKEFQKMTAYVPNPGYVGHGRQSDQVFALYHGMLRENERAGAYDLLRKDVLAHNCALSTGFFSTRYIFEVLTDGGDAELAGRLLTHEGFPGWFHMMDRGATTLWETWAETDNIYSQNHPMFGSCAAWMTRGILGIRVCEDAVGCDKVEIRPHAVAGMTAAAGHLDTPRGRISVSWRLENGKMVVEKTVPKGVEVVTDP